MRAYKYPSYSPDASNAMREQKRQPDGRRIGHPNHATKAKLTPPQVRWCRKHWNGTRDGTWTVAALAKKFVMSHQAMSNVVNRKVWQNI